MKEADIQRAIIDILEYSGWVVVKVNNVGIYKKATDSYIPPRQKGISDLLCCAPNGRFVAIEVKKPGNKPTEHQSEFLERVRATGGVGLVIDNPDTAIKLVQEVVKVV